MNKVFKEVQFYKLFINYFNNNNHRTRNTNRNIFASLIIQGLNIAISLLLIPMTIHYINSTQYGIWLTLSSIVTWASLFDLGLGNGLRNRLTAAIANENYELARKYVSTTYAILSIIIALVLFIFLIVNSFINWTKILNTPFNMQEELSLLALITFVFFSLRFILQLICTVLNANQENAKANILSFLPNAVSLIVIFILTRVTSGNLLYLGIVLGISPILILFISSLWLYRFELRSFSPSIKYVDFSFSKDLFNIGIQFFFIQVIALIAFTSSNIIISQIFGPAEVTPYAIGFRYFSIITMIFGIILAPYWSAITEAYYKNDIEWLRKTMFSLKQIWIVFSVLSLLMLLCSNLVYKIWIGKDIKISLPLSVFFCLYAIIYNWNSIFTIFINGVGKIRLQLISSSLIGIIFIPLTIFLAKLFGIVGIIISSCFCMIPAAIWSPIQYRKILLGKDKGIWRK